MLLLRNSVQYTERFSYIVVLAGGWSLVGRLLLSESSLDHNIALGISLCVRVIYSFVSYVEETERKPQCQLKRAACSGWWTGI